MNPPTPEPKIEQIKRALFAGQKIEAIKIYREQTNSGLKEAKDAIEKLEAELRASSPEKFTAAPAKVGCVGVVLVLVLVALMAAVVFSLLRVAK
jgi:ribosomal protein L7/L12